MTQVSVRGIEVVHLERGTPVSLHTLSPARERRGVLATVAFLAAGAGIGAGMAILVAHAIGKLVYLPAFASVWVALFAGLAWFAVPRVRARLGRYTIGAGLENDAFSPVSQGVTLIRRRDQRFELTVLPGMHGHIENGRLPIPVESLLEGRHAGVNEGRKSTVSLDEGAVARVTLGSSQFVIRSRPTTGDEASIPPDWMRPFGRTAVLFLQLGLVASLFCFGPSGRTIDDRMGVHMNLKSATPWEAEKWLRVEAQHQAPSLYQCFEQMPLGCQRPGYVGIGVSLSSDGEIRSHWIAHSTYDSQCPVEECMSEVVSTWAFDPLPQAMRVILPVQVLRTDKPLVMVHPVAELRVLDRACGAPDGPEDVAATGQTSAPVSLSVTEAWSVLLDSR